MSSQKKVKKTQKSSSFKKLVKVVGPGFLTGASDDDPSGIATYSQTGAQFGYTQLWTAVFTFPFMTIIQEMCGRIGLVTGNGLAGVIRDNYNKKILSISVLLVVIANIINIGADLSAMASSAQLILHIPFVPMLFGLTLITILLQVFISYKTYTKYLKYLTVTLFGYIVTAFIVKQDWTTIAFSTLVPHITLSKEFLINLVAILGTTISPYMFFWQTGTEVEEEIHKGNIDKIGGKKPKIKKEDIRFMQLDTVVGMLFSNVIMWFIILTTASTLHVGNIINIETADQAALALKPVAGDLAFILFALGIIGTGLLAVPILAATAAYALAETFGWEEGLYLKAHQASAFYGVIIASTLIGLLVNLTSIKPFQMLYYSAILNGICAPPLIILIILIGKNKKIMGSYTNSSFSNVMGYIITGIMSVGVIGMLISLLF